MAQAAKEKLDSEQARLLTLENTTADDFLLVDPAAVGYT